MVPAGPGLPFRGVADMNIGSPLPHQPGGLFDEQPSARHIYPHAIPALYARSVCGLTMQNSTVRFEGEGEAWDGTVCQLEDCRHTDLDLTARE